MTVTTKSKSYIFILHSTGMTNIRVTDLPADLKRQLGYTVPEDAAGAKNPGAWATKTLAKLEGPQLAGVKQELTRAWQGRLPVSSLRLPHLSTVLLVNLATAFLVLYLFFSYCSMLICQKAGSQPGILVFVPGLQAVPLFRAAGMSPWWLLGCFVPVLNLVINVLWCVKIVRARRKSGWVSLLLWLPLTAPFAFMYLAFSTAAPEEPEIPRIQVMALETA